MGQTDSASAAAYRPTRCHRIRGSRYRVCCYLALGVILCLHGVLRADATWPSHSRTTADAGALLHPAAALQPSGIADRGGYLRDVTAEMEKQWPANRTVNIVCHGHSVPAGYFKTPIVDSFHAYPHLLHRGLKERFPYAVLNVIVTAIGGEDSESGAKRFQRDVLSLRPDVVTIDYGLNDRRIGLDRAQVAWQAMIDQAKAAGIRVILLTPTPDMNAKLDDPADPLNRHAEQIRRLARENGTALVDSLACFEERLRAGTPLGSLMSQSNHPNYEGHQIVTAELLQWFVPSSTAPMQTGAGPETDADLRRCFAEPPQRYWPRPLWFWNNTRVTVETVKDQMRQARDRCHYGGFGILPFGKEFAPAYLSDAYFTVYGAALEQAKRLGLTLSLYDEYGFPSGSAGSRNSSDTSLFATRWPQLTIKRLDKQEKEISGPAHYEQALPEGKLMALVAMNTATLERIDLTETVRGGRLEWEAPAGRWRIMCFMCVTDGDPICDYLDPEAVDRFIELTHQAYYDRFAAHFGTTIDSTFFDEPTLYRAGGRTWTDQFNEKFRARYGFDPRPYYPALWYDIGPETQAARNYLFGFRAELYATGFPKRIQDWCDSHGIRATGHQDQEEVTNPVSVSGDLMKCFQYLDIPGIDKIGGNRPAERFYKIISSAAYNWDKSLVMSETYGAMGNLGWDAIYAVAMEQYTKGINMLIPHAMWYDDRNVTFKPELSWRNPLYAERLPEFNTYLARLNVLLQNDAAHVADIAVLYPIATLQGSHHLDGPLGYYQGGVDVPEADYVAVGELLAVDLGRDYTFLHPEVLEEKCTLDGGQLVLPNRVHPGQFRVLVLPGHQTIRWSSLQKIRAFYEQGGRVVATGRLPSQSAEFGHDDDVVRTVESLFGAATPNVGGDEHITIRRNPLGGCAIHLRTLTAEALREALDAAQDVYDVAFAPGRTLRYIHKSWNGRDVHFFANLNTELTESTITLRGRHALEAWDPHTGEIRPVQATYGRRSGIEVTQVHLRLPYLKSLFLVSPQ